MASSPTPEIANMQTVRLSDDLYGIHKVSAFELAHGLTRTLIGLPTALRQVRFDAHVTLQAKSKLFCMLTSKSTATSKLSPGDMLDVFLKTTSYKGGKWSSPRVVLTVDRDDVNDIRDDFETKAISPMLRVPRKENLAHPGTKSHSHLTDTLRLMLYDV